MSTPPACSKLGPMQLVAHRGHAREFPENTLPAFRSALDLGATHLELDVQLSADRVPVVLHDATLRRTAGRRGRVFDFTAADLARIDAGEPRRFGERYRGTTIPLLTDVLHLLDGRPDVILFVEIKRESLKQFGRDEVVGPIVKTCAPWGRQCVAISFDRPAIARARELGASAVGWVLSDLRERTRLACEALAPEYLFVDVKKLPRAGPLWRGAWRWVAYEVDSPPAAHALAARGVAFIETMAVRTMTERA
jgi:glycerophosphoryl diester phosphodiesterase